VSCGACNSPSRDHDSARSLCLDALRGFDIFSAVNQPDPIHPTLDPVQRALRRVLVGVALLALTLAPAQAAMRVTEHAGEWTLENRQLQVLVRPGSGTIFARDRASGQEWIQTAAANGKAMPAFRNVRRIEQPTPRLALEMSVEPGSTNPLSLTLSLPARGADLFVEVDLPDRHVKIGNLFVLEPFVSASTNLGLVVADYANGHLYPLNEKPPHTWFNLYQIDLPWVGVCDLSSGAGYALIVETDDDACIRLVKTEREGREVWGPQAGFQSSHREFRYPRKFFYHFASEGGYVALAKRFREFAREQGLLVTFREKLKQNPNIARVFGAPDVWGDGSLKFARDAKAAGIEKMLIHGRASAEDMKAINDLGYLASNYDIYADMLQVEAGKDIDSHHGQVPADVVLKEDGERMKAWLTWDKQQYMKRCPAVAVNTAHVVIPKDLAQRPFLGRFIDVATAEELYECYDPAHPLTRSGKRQASAELLGYTRSLGLVTGGEHGRYWAVPQLDYIEGMMSGGSYSWPAGWLLRPKSKDQEFDNPYGGKFDKWANYEKWGIGHATRVPLWELVFHDCIVSTWYWGDSSEFLLQAAPEVTPRKDAFNILYGTIPMFWANREGGWRADRELCLRTYRNTCKLHEAIAGTEMLSHEFVTSDRAVQRTKFSDGTEVIVNFGPTPFEAKLGRRKHLLPQNGFAVKGPKIEQSLALVDGKAVTTIRTKTFQFTETRP
jgi:hypothetical protein